MELHVCNRSGALLKSYALGDAVEVLVGRDETCDVRIASRSVSREHCLIEQQGDGMVLRDLDSTGGTFVEGARVETVRLRDGMEATVGPAVLKFYENDV